MKSELTKAKEVLWKLCREIMATLYPEGDCYTCGAKNLQGSNKHLGHFISSSICSTEMRYDLSNLRWQCYLDNIHRSGNWVAYERHLKEELGDGYPDYLKERNRIGTGAKYGLTWIRARTEEYMEVLSNIKKELKNASEADYKRIRGKYL